MKKFIRKALLIFFLFISTFTILLFTKLPAYFDSYVYIDNYKFIAHFYLVFCKRQITDVKKDPIAQI